MDPGLVERLAAEGIDTTLRERIPTIAVPFDEEGQLLSPDDDEWGVVGSGRAVFVRLKPIRELWSGDARPPAFVDGPTRGFVAFFGMIELTAADFCVTTGIRVTDKEFEHLYSQLRRRPDGTDAHPLFEFLRAAARLYMSIRETSQGEFEAVVSRLEKSARTCSVGWASTNYVTTALEPLLGAGRGAPDVGA